MAAAPPAARIPTTMQVLDGCGNPAAATTRLTLPDLGEILTVRARENNPRARPWLAELPGWIWGS